MELDSFHTPCFSEGMSLKITYMLCLGLELFEKNNLVHGDISPQNILLSDVPVDLFMDNIPFAYNFEFIPVIIDFGEAHKYKEESHIVTSVIGTKHFTAPEILSYNKKNDRMDIYSLGCILFYLCMGTAPGKPDAINYEAALSKQVLKIIKKCTSDYDLRYKNVKELENDIRQVLNMPNRSFGNIMRHVPGFRTKKIWKMIIAIYFYLTFAMSVVANILIPSRDNVYFQIFFVVEVVLVCDVFSIGSRIKRYATFVERRPKARYLLKIAIAAAVFLLYSILWYL